MQRIFSGIQPTGVPHLGNYLGAIRNWVSLQDGHECLFCLVDLHAITVWQEPSLLREQTRLQAAVLIAAGIDPDRHILFNQSAVSAHARLAWIFNCISRIGWLNRMTQFKDKAGRDREAVSSGLYVYPNLMAADILTYHATRVPVGDDQRQHLELANDIAQKFNHDYEVAFFPAIEALVPPGAARVMSLRDGTRKMSKSDPSEQSRITLVDDADAVAQKLRRAKTDPAPLPDTVEGLADRPEARNLVEIYSALAGTTPATGAGRTRRQRLRAVQGGADRHRGRGSVTDSERDAPVARRHHPSRSGVARRCGARECHRRTDRRRGRTHSWISQMRQAVHYVVVETRGKGLRDITAPIADWVAMQAMQTALLTIWCRHTSASLTVQENADPTVREDINRFFDALVPEGNGRYVHDDEGLDDMPAHLRSMLTQTQLSVPVADGAMVLGTWQGIYLFEHRKRPHRRELVLHLLGD